VHIPEHLEALTHNDCKGSNANLTASGQITTLPPRMSMLDKLSRWVGGSSAAAHAATAALTECYVDCLTRARQLAQHAEMAPQDYSTAALNELAAAEEAQAQRLRQALQAVEAEIPAARNGALPAGALNHWARLVQDLEAHRRSMRRLRELAIHFAETFPSTAQLFDDMCREESTHCERLRTLIARADPQALD
jgi:hypothetical protein